MTYPCNDDRPPLRLHPHKAVERSVRAGVAIRRGLGGKEEDPHKFRPFLRLESPG